MYTSVIRDLRLEAIWEPARLTAQAFRWPISQHEAPVEGMVVRVFPNSIADAGAPVITPANLDSTTGGIRRRSRNYQGAVFQVGRELQPGDVLVPSLGLGPALRISDALRGALVAARFTALRPHDPELSAWIWAVLNCDSGLRLRSHLSTGLGSAVDARNLLDATIPIPSSGDLAALTPAIAAIEATTRRDEHEPIETWWSTADLRTLEWRIALATPDPERLESGPPLREYCSAIIRGRNTRPFSLDSEEPGYLPVLDVSTLGGKPPRRWLPVEADNQTVAQPGHLVVAGLGKFAYATVVTRPAVIDRHVFLLQLNDDTLGPAIAGFLNSRDGYALRQIFLRGSTVPSISNSDIGKIPIPHGLLEQFVDNDAAPIFPLSQRLERALWRG